MPIVAKQKPATSQVACQPTKRTRPGGRKRDKQPEAAQAVAPLTSRRGSGLRSEPAPHAASTPRAPNLTRSSGQEGPNGASSPETSAADGSPATSSRAPHGAANPIPNPDSQSSLKLTPERQAYVLQNGLLPVALVDAVGLEKQLKPAGYRLYLDRLIQNAGAPSDPVEVILLEQLVLCHLRAQILTSQSGQAKDQDGVRVYGDMAIRLTAECRKLSLALQQYRASSATQQLRGSAGQAAPPRRQTHTTRKRPIRSAWRQVS